AVFRVGQLGIWVLVLEGDEHLSAEDFVEALCSWRKSFEVGVVERPEGGLVENLEVPVVKLNMHHIGRLPIAEALVSEDDCIAGKGGFEGLFASVESFVAELRRNIGAGILMQCFFNRWCVVSHPQFSC